MVNGILNLTQSRWTYAVGEQNDIMLMLLERISIMGRGQVYEARPTLQDMRRVH